MNAPRKSSGVGLADVHASWENEGGAISSPARSRQGTGARMLSGGVTQPLKESVGSDEVVSLTSSGARNWVIPPFVIPSAIAAMIVVYALYRS